VFELVVVGLMPAADKAGVLAAVALFRIIYTFIPFLLGVMVIVWMEGRAVRDARRRMVAPERERRTETG
jgi:uncharacterized membrane protein YbhN (UPF0104 family)